MEIIVILTILLLIYNVNYLKGKIWNHVKFHKSCLSASFWNTWSFWEIPQVCGSLPDVFFDEGFLEGFFDDFFEALHVIWRIFGNWILRTVGSGHISLLREGNWATEDMSDSGRLYEVRNLFHTWVDTLNKFRMKGTRPFLISNKLIWLYLLIFISIIFTRNSVPRFAGKFEINKVIERRAHETSKLSRAQRRSNPSSKYQNKCRRQW